MRIRPDVSSPPPPTPLHKRMIAVLSGAVLALVSAATIDVASDVAAADPRPAQTHALDILLTNDDGWRGAAGSQTPLIVALRDALEAAGHHVVVVAPGTDQSGQGGRLTVPPTQLQLANPEPDVWTVTPGSSADTVFFGFDEIFVDDQPDLVISGMNPGANTTSAVIHSGTVNGALTALELGVPSIAVSLDRRPDWPAGTLAAAGDAATYVVDLVAELQANPRRGRLMPDRVSLNVNYPIVPGPIDPGTGLPGSVLDPNGTRPTTLSIGPYLAIDYSPVGTPPGQPGTYTIGLGQGSPDASRGTDVRALRDGFVSITALEADHDLDGSTRHWLQDLTDDLT